MKMKTRERILHASLALFNEFGESNVTTLQIADELNISPGNLYYHFRSKSDIVRELFGWYEAQINHLLEVPEVEISIEDQWLFLHLIFENIAEYRFIYQDLINVLSRYETLRAPFRRILKHKRLASRTICNSLREQALLKATDAEIEGLCEQITLTTTYWLSFEMLAHLEEKDAVDLGRGVYQVMFLLAPYLREDERRQLETLGQSYLN
ncbi:TetR/AcrR family transcriptional regulator [Hydrocarboniclastica marina]|nr:TetR/AcrR family transcriptional regulator [Hydrocarboniclastica marina]|tara:strand:- start:157 stop:783 length:627 start_codon:yes stop_codon:yes gene_type:complete